MYVNKPRPSRWVPVFLTAGVVFALAEGVARCETADSPDQPDAGTTQDSDAEKIRPELARLAVMVGPWKVVERHFDARGKEIGTVKGTEEVKRILDKLAIERTYRTKAGGRVFRAVGLLAYNDLEKRYDGVWFDNFSTSGHATVKGEWDEESRALVFTIDSVNAQGEPVQHKVVEKFLDEERREATTYAVEGSVLVKRLEVQYHRTIPCPSRIRIIYDGLERQQPKKKPGQ